jgi:hypothetical protein
MKSLVFALVCSLLVACGAAPIKPAIIYKTQDVDIAVAVPCLKKIPQQQKSFLSDQDLLSGSGAQVFDKVWADHLGRRDDEQKLLAAMQACIAPPANTSQK